MDYNPAHSPGSEPGDLGNQRSGQNLPAHPGSQCALFCLVSSGLGALNESTTYIETKQENRGVRIKLLKNFIQLLIGFSNSD